MARFKVHIEYEGTRYSGWQVQTNARTVQGEILRVLQEVLKTTQMEFQGAGRTDAGVHALHQVAHLDVETMLGPEIIRLKVNDLLPADINILEVEKTRPAFHARHDAVARSYLYQISLRRTAFGKRFVWWSKDRLNIDAMQDAAQCFTGMKDFKAFTDADPEESSTKTLIEEIVIHREGDLVLLRVVGSHFLWKLVRRLVAEVGRGKMKSEDIPALFSAQSDVPAKLTAPPSGLFLERVYYAGDPRNTSLEPVLPIGSLHVGKHRPQS